MNDDGERWQSIPDYDGLYEVSNLGRVRSLDRVQELPCGHTRRYRGRIMRVQKIGRWRNSVLLRDPWSKTGQRRFLVSTLVLSAFCGLPSPGHVARRRDVRGGDCLSNLYWGKPLPMTDVQKLSPRSQKGIPRLTVAQVQT